MTVDPLAPLMELPGVAAASDVVRARSAPVAAQTSPNSNAHSMRRSRNRYPLTCSQVVAGLGTGSPTVAR